MPCGMWGLSSPTRDRIRVPCIGRRILYHWTTREVPGLVLSRCPNLGLESNLLKPPSFFFFFNKFIYFIIYLLFLAVLGLCCCAHAFSSCGERGYSSLRCAGFSLLWSLSLWSTGSRCVGFSSCGSRALECRLSSCGARA